MPRWGLFAAAACATFAALVLTVREPPEPAPRKWVDTRGRAKATFAAGCFWCTEAVFQRVNGVLSVVSGYTGGTVANPTYEDVTSETTGHAEAIEVTYDPNVVPYETLLEVFWKTHDPTTPNRQGNDHGTRYRSAIFYHDDDQRQVAESYKQKLADADFFKGNIVTEIVPAKAFYPAEDYHQDLLQPASPSTDCCQVVIAPQSSETLQRVFGDKLR